MPKSFNCTEISKIFTGQPFDKLGVVVLLISLQYHCITPLAILMGSALMYLANLGVDPVHLSFVYGFNTKKYILPIPVIAVYIFLLYYAGSDLCRRFCTDIVQLLVSAEYFKKILKHIRKQSRSHLLEAMKMYRDIGILMNIGLESACFLLGQLMVVGYVGSMICGSVTIVGYQLLPPHIYWIAPTFTLFAWMLMVCGLPYATEIYRISQDMLREWKWRLANTVLMPSLSFKILHRKVRVLRPIFGRIWSFRKLDTETLTTYLASVAERTMNVIIYLKLIK